LLALSTSTNAACGGDSTAEIDGGPPRDTGTGIVDSGTERDGGTERDANVDDGGKPPGCPTPTSGPTTHTGVTTDETWTADTSPHIVPNSMNVNAGVTLTLAPCSEVRIGTGQTLTVRGHLVSAGTAEQPVLITSNGGGPFAQIRNYGTGTTIRLTYTTVEQGGDPLTSAPDLTGTIFVQGDVAEPTQGLLHVDHVTVQSSASNGIVAIDGSGFTDESTDLTVEGAAAHPVSLWPPAIYSLPAGAYTGNAVDEILVPGGGGAQAIVRDTTFHDRGVPYRIGSSTSSAEIVVDAGSTGLATLTIEPGVVLRFVRDGAFWVERFVGPVTAGAVIAVGTATDPIVFTSAEASPAAGDWAGIHFASTPDGTSRLEHVRVEYAGGETSFGSSSCPYAGQPMNWAAIRFDGNAPSSQLVTNTTIAYSLHHGIDRGWAGAPVDFLPTNTFTDVARCDQTLPRPASGACPGAPPCP
jgi:hypothetical protein